MLEKLAAADGQKMVILDYVTPFEAVHESNREKSRLMLRSLEKGLGWPIMVYHTSDSTQAMEKTKFTFNQLAALWK